MCNPKKHYEKEEGIMKKWFFDVSNGIEEVSEGGCDQIDHGDESGGISVSARPCPCGLEEAVQPFEAGVGVG
jgi:hypothetical protein